MKDMLIIRSFGEITKETVERSLSVFRISNPNSDPETIVILPFSGVKKIAVQCGAFTAKSSSVFNHRTTIRREAKHIRQLYVPLGMELVVEGDTDGLPPIESVSLIKMEGDDITSRLETCFLNREKRVSSVNTLGLRVKTRGGIIKKNLIVHQVRR